MHISQLAKRIQQEAIIIEGQLAFEVDMPWSFNDKWLLLEEYKKAGFTAVTLSIANEETITDQAMAYLAKIRKHIFANPEHYLLAKTKEDILTAKKHNKLAIRLMLQGTNPIAKNLDLLELFYALGVTSLVLAYNIQTPYGSGVIEKNDNGLTLLGRQLIAEANRLGITLDGSHAGYQTSMDAMLITQKPFVFSHSGIYALNPHARNVRDEQLIALAKTGGVIGINGLGLLLGDANAALEKYVEHIDYVRKLIGIEHVAIGLDNLYFATEFAEFMQSQAVTHPTAYASVVNDAINWRYVQASQIIELIELLLAKDYQEAEIKAFLGENILRLL